MARFNGYWMAEMRKIAKGDVRLDTFLDVIGGGPKTNDYSRLSPVYKKTDHKPDKLYSHLPTVLRLVGDCRGKTVLDLGCGSGFYTLELAAAGARRVIGMDNAEAQLALAREHAAAEGVEYVNADIFTDTLPHCDIIVAPYVVNYAKNVAMLEALFKKFFDSLKNGGKAVLVIDLPSRSNLMRFGATKVLLGEDEDGSRIRIDLYTMRGAHICPLYCTYFKTTTVQSTLRKVGFRKIRWHDPTVSDEGVQALGAEFWEGYSIDPQLGYITAEK
jgi:SAM-dependent methyltransferase